MKNKIDYAEKLPTIRIINIEAGEIYHHILSQEDLVIENKNDVFDSHFSDLMPANLDLLYLNENDKLSFKQLDKEYYSFDLVNVSFSYPLRMNDKKERVFKQKDTTETVDAKTMRETLYLRGFVLNGKKYVRYKRSSGSAKAGRCLFIKENLYSFMNKWSMTDLDESKDLCLKSLTAYEAYRALSLSSLIATFKLNPYNILFVKDYKVVLHDEEVIRVSHDKNKGLVAQKDKCDITNNIFDGEGLLDYSIFKENNYEHKGMLLLRNRFFKCCAFNTNLQEWFKENNITSVDQLNGVTFAKDIKDIVLVANESCLKYLKMCEGEFNRQNILRWCDAISDENSESLFGVVKTDKRTRFFDGDMVETTYQLLNTLQMKEKDIRPLIRPYFEYIQKIRDIKNQPQFLRFYLEGEVGNEDSENTDDSEGDMTEKLLEYSSYSFKNKVCLDLMKIDKDIIYTSLFKYHIFQSLIASFLLKIYNGRTLVDGTYATIFGNPYEFLNYIILKDNKPVFNEDNQTSLLGKGEIYSPFFGDGVRIVGSRAPHTTMGNILVVENKILAPVRKWFNLNPNIVVVDAINNNIQHRLSGCDYDSDTILLTNNPEIGQCAERNYDKFLVPYADYSSTNKEMKHIVDDKKENRLRNLANIDTTIATNNVGKIVNLSQLLNSHLWNKYNKSKRYDFSELYEKIAILSVLSGAEIDSSKRTFPFDTTTEYKRIVRYAKKENLYNDKPMFFANISNSRGRKLKIGEIKKLLDDNHKFKTTMDYLWSVTSSMKIMGEVERMETITLSSLICRDFKTAGISKTVYDQIDGAIASLKETRDIIKQNNIARKNNDNYDLAILDFRKDIDECYQNIKTAINKVDKVKLLVKKLQEEKNPNSLLYILLYIISIHSGSDIDYSLRDLFGENLEPIPTLKKVGYGEQFEYTLFESHHYKLDAAENLINLIFQK